MKIKLFFTVLLICNLTYVLGQHCGTPDPINPTVYPQQNTSLQAKGSSSSICINVFFHIVRNTNGTNAFTPPSTRSNALKIILNNSILS